MSLSKTASLPQLKVNLNKYDNFFSRRSSSKELAMDQQPDLMPESESMYVGKMHKKAHLKNLEVIDKKSTIKSKVEAFLTDSHKMGILDHTKNETSNRRSLTKISLQAMKPVKTQAEQQLIYLTKLKSQINFYSENNRRMEAKIKNTKGITTQVKQKIIFFQQLMSRTWASREELLTERERNIVYIRFETDRLRYMEERLREINVNLKMRVKDAQNKLRKTESEAKNLNDLESIRQAQLDNKQYLLRHYDDFQYHKSQNMLYKTDKAMFNMQENHASHILKKHQDSISIMQRDDYKNQCIEINHQKLTREMLFHHFYAGLLDSVWTKYSAYYESYEKAEQLIKMHCRDRRELVQDSYRKCFEVKKELEEKIKDKEEALKQIEGRNRELKAQVEGCCFQEIEEIEQRINSMVTDVKTGKAPVKTAKEKEEHLYHKSIVSREDQITRCKKVYTTLKNWLLKHESNLSISVSKKSGLGQHFTEVIQFIQKELKDHQPNYKLPEINKSKGNSLPKMNKYGNIKKRK